MSRATVSLCAALAFSTLSSPLFAQPPDSSGCPVSHLPCEPEPFVEPSDPQEEAAEVLGPTQDQKPKEKREPSGSFQIGAGFSSEENFIATARIAQSNLFGTGAKLSLDTAISARRQQVLLHFSTPEKGLKDAVTSIDLGFSERLFLNGVERSWTGGRITQEWKIAPDWSLSLHGAVADVKLGVPGSAFPEDLLQAGRSASAGISLLFDTAPSSKNPAINFRHKLSLEATKNLDGNTSFLRAEKELGYSFTFGQTQRSPKLRLGAKFGYLLPTTEGADISIADRYFAGGADSVRGFTAQSLGPKLRLIDAPDGATREIAIGGTSQVLLRSELEIPLLPKAGIKGVLFLDAGNVFGGLSSKESSLVITPEKDFGVLPLRTAAGVGIRWESPIGPLDFMWGVPLDRRPGEAPVQFMFSIGRSF